MGQSILSQLLTQRSKMTAFHKSWERWPKHVWQWCVLCLTNTFVCKHACITASAFLSEHLRWADGKKLALILTMGSLCLSLGKLPCACFLVPFTCEAKCIQCKHTYFFGFKKEAMFRGTDERGAVYFCCIGVQLTRTPLRAWSTAILSVRNSVFGEREWGLRSLTRPGIRSGIVALTRVMPFKSDSCK